MKGMSIATRVFLGFVAIIAVFAAVSTFSQFRMNTARQTIQRLNRGYLPLAQVMARVEGHQQNRLQQLIQVFETTEAGRARREGSARLVTAYFPDRLAEDLTDLRDMLNELERQTFLEPPDRTFLSEMDQAAVGLLTRGRELKEASTATIDRLLTGSRPSDGEIQQLFQEERAFARRIMELSQAIESRIQRNMDRLERQETTAAWAHIGLVALAILVALAVLAALVRSVRPLFALAESVRAVSRGDYSLPAGPTGDGEIALLATEFERLRLSLRDRENHLSEKTAELEQANRELGRLTALHTGIFNNLPMGVAALSSDDRITAANPFLLRVFGLSASAVIDRPLAEAVPDLAIPTDQPDLNGPAREALRLRDGEGRWLHFALHRAPLRRADGSVSGRLLILEDTTAETQVKDRLISSERLAAVGRIAAHITHEVRNPLSSIALNTEMIGDELRSEAGLAPDRMAELLRLLGAITREVDRLHTITEEYLAFARLPRPELSPVDLNGVIGAFIEFHHQELERRGARISFLPGSNLPPVEADGRQIGQLLLNLCRNAVEAMPDGGEIGIMTCPAPGGGVELAISDQGTGMTPEVLAQLFTPFFSTRRTGTGLGLTICQRIVSEHRGTIRCDSDPGRGTTFTISFPTT